MTTSVTIRTRGYPATVTTPDGPIEVGSNREHKIDIQEGELSITVRQHTDEDLPAPEPEPFLKTEGSASLVTDDQIREAGGEPFPRTSDTDLD